ncbi:MAG: serine/threonine protein phosphatase [Chlorobiaceae bacterium]|nr:serine/threonine protein phosphatase [Chlorobiaceae bacterium]MBA4308764.1 serine/threonine protein phosphatase [Chlorobiaceae bacterium]
MYYKNLHQTIENITSKLFESEEEMLTSVIDELIHLKEVSINGGRIWKLNRELMSYELVYQTGKIDKIKKNFLITIKDYPLFSNLINERTILSTETDPYLRDKGILKYTASGVGDKIKLHGKRYYEFVLAFNSPKIDMDLKYSINIISAVLTSKLKQSRTTNTKNNLLATLDSARQLQKSILPEHEFNFHDYDLYGLTVPAEIVGGDFFDYLEIGDDNDRIGIALGDAASKGVAAAAEAMYISGALRMAMTFEIKIALLVKRLNQLVNRIFSDDKFCSLFYGELSLDSKGLFIYANAGHNPPMFIKKNSDEIFLLNPTGPVLGPAPKEIYSVENINFEDEDVLLIFSDGVVESVDSKFELFGEERVQNILRESKHLTPKEIALSLMEAVQKFSANGLYSDDKTIVVIKKSSGKKR